MNGRSAARNVVTAILAGLLVAVLVPYLHAALLIARAADILLSIPIRQETDSVNAATAAGIFLYEAARQRKFSHRTEP